MLRWFEVLTRRRTATVAAFAMVGAVAIFQTLIIVKLAVAQTNTAHIIDLSGLQRTRSQQLAYLAVSATSAVPEQNLLAKTDSLIGDMVRTRAEVLRHPQYAEPLDHFGGTALGEDMVSYFANVRQLERHPRDRAALLDLQQGRVLFLAALDNVVTKRVQIAAAAQQSLIADLFLGLLLQLATITGVGLMIVAPSNRRIVSLLSDLDRANEEMESSFAGNPDSIAVYDVDGYLRRVNDSRSRLYGAPSEDVIGRHILEFVNANDAERISQFFARACAGETVNTETKFVVREGRPVEVAVTMYPRLLNNVVVGINTVSKDLTALRAAEAAGAEQRRRLEDLYAIASSYDADTQAQLCAAIHVMTASLGYDYGVVTEISNDVVTLVAKSGDVRGLVVGHQSPYRGSLSQITVEAEIVFEARDFEASPYTAAAMRRFGWTSVAGMKIVADGKIHGTVGFASTKMREADLSVDDISFMRLSCALFATIIERDRQIRQLDALASFDTLTKVRNRAEFGKRLAELVATGLPFALHSIDLDGFKAVNDRFGHTAGDAVLQIAATRLLHVVRSADDVFRLGGDEFAILQAGTGSADEALSLASRIIASFREPIEAGASRHLVGSSVGIAMLPAHGTNAVELVEAADAALYRAKQSGRGRYVVAVAAEPTVLTRAGRAVV